jgi:hypothetical protein
MRVVYRGDLDGTLCTAILIDVGLGDEITQAHPKDMQDGKVDITGEDILCNLPYHPNCGMWFDHHSTEIENSHAPTDFKGLAEVAPSAAGLVYRYFLPDHPELEKYEQIVTETDLIDSADLTKDQVMNPRGTFLLGFLLDPRTGLGLSRDFSISNYQWSLQLPKLLTQHTVEEILAMPDSQERVKRYNEMQEKASDFYQANSRLEGNVIVTDVRDMAIPPTNRFLIYAIPGLEQGNISVRMASGKQGEFNTISVAYSIFNRTSSVDCGALCKSYGGGGHRAVATCQPSVEDSDRVFAEIIAACQD